MARKKSIRRPNPKLRRDQGRFNFWLTPAGNWRGQLSDKSEPSFAAKAPTKKYKDKKGVWRTKTGKKTTSPALFVKKKAATKATDKQALVEFQKLLNKLTSSVWSLRIDDAISSRLPLGHVKGKDKFKSVQGFRTVAMYTSSRPFITDWFQLQDVVRAASENPLIIKVFGSRRTAMHIEYEDEQGVTHWTTPYLARDFNTTFTQADSQIGIWAAKYVIKDDEDDPESAIRRIQLLVE